MLSSFQESQVQTLCSNIVSISDLARKKHRLARIEFKLINILDLRAFNVDFYHSN